MKGDRLKEHPATNPTACDLRETPIGMKRSIESRTCKQRHVYIYIYMYKELTHPGLQAQADSRSQASTTASQNFAMGSMLECPDVASWLVWRECLPWPPLLLNSEPGVSSIAEAFSHGMEPRQTVQISSA